MNFFQRLRLAWRMLCYRGPWLPRFVSGLDEDDDPSIFDYPPDVVPDFPAPGSDREVRLVLVDTPMLRLIPRKAVPVTPMAEWKPIGDLFATKEAE